MQRERNSSSDKIADGINKLTPNSSLFTFQKIDSIRPIKHSARFAIDLSHISSLDFFQLTFFQLDFSHEYDLLQVNTTYF